jgi:hypothetical protein
LPSGYDVHTTPEAFTFEASGISYRYEPYMVVIGHDGRRLIVEVKSRHSLSLSNIAKLAAVQRRAESDGAQFLVIVPDAISIQPANESKEFVDLHIAYSQGTANVVPAILDALIDALNSRSPGVPVGADAPRGAAVSAVSRQPIR